MAASGGRARTAPALNLLVEAFSIGTTLDRIPENCRPRTLAEAYALQTALVETLAIETAGWKIGCTSEAARKILTSDGPFAGRVFLPRCFASGTVIPSHSYPMRGLEGEFAFVLGKDLKPRKKPYTRAEVAAAVADLHPAIEIIDSR